VIAVIVETNGSGVRYGVSDEQLDSRMVDGGFEPFSYAPLVRRLARAGERPSTGNTLYLRNTAEVQKRLEGAPRVELLGLGF
jgi:hypothetical protein